MGTGSEVKTGSDGMVAFNYPDNGGVMTLGANSDAGWVYLVPQTDPITGNVTYAAVPPSATGAFAFSEGIEPDEFGQAGLSLAAEVGVGLAVLAVTGAPITLGGALVVEGTLLLGSGIAYVNEQLSPQQGTYDVRPVQVPQGLVMGSGTQYVVSIVNGATIIQVIEGSVLFVDQYTNNTVTIQADQMLTLPSGVNTGFTAQELQSYVSAFDSSSINQWWTQITPTATATPTIIATSTTVTQNGALSFLFDPMIIAALIVVIIVVTLLVVLRSKSHSRKQKVANQRMPQPPMPQTPQTTAPITESPAAPLTPTVTQPKLAFCPNCGKQLSNPKGFCPFCGFDLAKFKAEATK
jgi:hypothetical protein